MDIGSFLIFSAYILIILMILVYVSPLVSALVMLLIPICSVLILPSSSIEFLSLKQFSLVEGRVPIYNIHILLMVWSAMIGIIVYTEVLSWYLLRDKEIKSEVEAEQSYTGKIKDFLMKLRIK